jgi:hypothetical protein
VSAGTKTAYQKKNVWTTYFVSAFLLKKPISEKWCNAQLLLLHTLLDIINDNHVLIDEFCVVQNFTGTSI